MCASYWDCHVKLQIELFNIVLYKEASVIEITHGISVLCYVWCLCYPFTILQNFHVKQQFCKVSKPNFIVTEIVRYWLGSNVSIHL